MSRFHMETRFKSFKHLKRLSFIFHIFLHVEHLQIFPSFFIRPVFPPVSLNESVLVSAPVKDPFLFLLSDHQALMTCPFPFQSNNLQWSQASSSKLFLQGHEKAAAGPCRRQMSVQRSGTFPATEMFPHCRKGEPVRWRVQEELRVIYPPASPPTVLLLGRSPLRFKFKKESSTDTHSSQSRPFLFLCLNK